MAEGVVFWVWALIFSAILGVGLYLMFPTGRLIGATLTILGMVGLLVLLIPHAIQPPRLIVYAPVVSVASAVIAGGLEFLRDRDLRMRLRELHSSLKDFTREIVARAAELDARKGLESKIPEYDKWISAEFASRYEKRLTEAYREAIKVGWLDTGIAGKLLNAPFREDSPSYWISGTKIGVMAAWVNGLTEHPSIQSEWLRRPSFWRMLALYLVASAIIWCALSVYSHY